MSEKKTTSLIMATQTIPTTTAITSLPTNTLLTKIIIPPLAAGVGTGTILGLALNKIKNANNETNSNKEILIAAVTITTSMLLCKLTKFKNLFFTTQFITAASAYFIKEKKNKAKARVAAAAKEQARAAAKEQARAAAEEQARVAAAAKEQARAAAKEQARAPAEEQARAAAVEQAGAAAVEQARAPAEEQARAAAVEQAAPAAEPKATGPRVAEALSSIRNFLPNIAITPETAHKVQMVFKRVVFAGVTIITTKVASDYYMAETGNENAQFANATNMSSDFNITNRFAPLFMQQASAICPRA